MLDFEAPSARRTAVSFLRAMACATTTRQTLNIMAISAKSPPVPMTVSIPAILDANGDQRSGA